MIRREEIHKENLHEAISVEAISSTEVSILCPEVFANKLYNFLVEHVFSPSPPKPAIIGTRPDAEIVATCNTERANALIAAFVSKLSLEDFE